MDKELLGIKEFSGNAAEMKSPFSGKNVTFKVASAGSAATDHLLAICQGWYPSKDAIKDSNGNACSSIITDGTYDTTTNDTITATGVGCKVVDVVNMLRTTPCRIKGIKVKVDDETQLSQEIQFLELTPEGSKVISKVIPSNSKTENNQDAKLASINLLEENIITGPDALFLMKLGAGRTATITIFYENRASFRAQVEVASKRGLI